MLLIAFTTKILSREPYTPRLRNSIFDYTASWELFGNEQAATNSQIRPRTIPTDALGADNGRVDCLPGKESAEETSSLDAGRPPRMDPDWPLQSY